MSGSGGAMNAVAAFDALPMHEAAPLLESCCGATAWVNGMTERRPFHTLDRVLAAADEVWWSLGSADWREAFDHHPRIGEQKATVTQGARAQAWSRGEQDGVADAPGGVREALALGNAQYEQRFGYIYLVCATGKSAEELLAILQARLTNDPVAEIRVAAGEQAKITRLRLTKMFSNPQPNSPE